MALNVEKVAMKAKTDNMTPNVKMEMRLWTLKWKCSSERQIEDVAMNIEMRRAGGFERRNWKEIMALNTKMWRTTLNVVTKKIWRL